MRETAKEIHTKIEECFEDAKYALAQYELSLALLTEHILWLLGLDLIVTVRWDDGIVISVNAPTDRYEALKSACSEPLEDILAELVCKHDRNNWLRFRFESNVILTKKEAAAARKRLRLGGGKAKRVRHENGKQIRE